MVASALLVLNAFVLCAMAIDWLLARLPALWVRWAAALLALCILAEQVNFQIASQTGRSSELT
jgi:hypothetical protein